MSDPRNVYRRIYASLEDPSTAPAFEQPLNVQSLPFFEMVHRINQLGSPVPPGPTFNANRVCFYAGMMCEELAEHIETIAGGAVSRDDRNKLTSFAAMLQLFGREFKTGNFEGDVLRADREKLLDSAYDCAIVAAGSSVFQTPQFMGGLFEVMQTQFAKFPGGVALRNPDTGKMVKPPGWKEPDLSPFISKPID